MENAGIVWRAFVATVIFVCAVLFFLWIATPAPAQERACQPIDEMIARTADLQKQRGAAFTYMRLDDPDGIVRFLQAAREAGYPHPAEDQVRHLVFFTTTLNPDVIHIAVHTDGECFIGGAMIEKPLVLDMLRAALGRVQFTPAQFQQSLQRTFRVQCGSYNRVIASLADDYGEAVRSNGTMGRTRVMEAYVSASGSWTIVVTDTTGMSCIVAAGENWEDVPLVAVVPGENS